MKIAIISTSDTNDGPSKRAHSLHRSLLANSVTSRMFVQHKNSNDYTVIGPETRWEKLKEKVIYPGIEDLARSFLFRGNKIFHSPAIISSINWKKVLAFDPDVINVHWVCRGMMKPEDLLKIKRPIVLTMHDMWNFCGGEHVIDDDSIRHIEGYTRNNRSSGETGLDANKWIWHRKYRVFKKTPNLNIVVPSFWLVSETQASKIFFGRDVARIPYCIDPDICKPLNKYFCRQIFNLPQDKKIIMFGAANGTSNVRKGFKYLKEAIKLVANSSQNKDLCLVVFGNSQPDNNSKLDLPIFHLGQIRDEKLLAAAYSSADVMVVPSLRDNFPNTVLEPMFCGIPVVGFKVGGIPDMIEHQKNGYLAEPLNSTDLARGIEWVLSDDNRREGLSKRAREKCLEEFSPNIVAQKYIDLFEKIMP